MVRAFFCSLMVLPLFVVGLAGAADSKSKSDKDKTHDKATIAKVDSKKGTVTVTMKDEKGKKVDKTLQLAEGVEYLDGHGKAAKLDAFQAGDHVRITEKDGKITELKKCMEHATITKVDAKKGTVAVKMKGHDGKEVDKTFQLAEGVKYFDGHGKAAKLDAFQPGNHVRFTEKDGKIAELKECAEQAQATITEVDAENGTVTMMMKDGTGKKTEKVFYLTEDAEYVDSSGEVAVIDVFQSGDDVLIIESDGQLVELKADAEPTKTGDKVKKTSSVRKSGAK